MTYAYNVTAIRNAHLGAVALELENGPPGSRPLSQEERSVRSGNHLRGLLALGIGQPIGIDEYCVDWLIGEPKKMAPMFSMGGLIPVVTATARAAMEAFDLGDTRFHPITPWASDRKTRIESEPLFIVNCCNVKSALKWEGDRVTGSYTSRHEEHGGVKRWRGFFPGRMIFGPDALEGPDLWMEKHLINGLFLSPRMAEGLTEAGLVQGWYLEPTLTDTGSKVENHDA